ncbi:MAG TPA: LCP family protein [Thermoleophilaceae bacterium]|nr:LCP family protein [Thermoleophilaceae bacterium]
MFEDTPRPGLWKRLLLGAVVVILASAGATAVAAFREVDRVVSALKQQPELKLGKQLAQTDPGDPQTLMILGSDRRPQINTEGALPGARSDTIILMRLDPDKKAIALMSLPRDLQVRIPGHGTDKINAAYEQGGPKLTLQTVKRLTGLPINHVINVDFRGFWAAVDAIGCVYADIDRRYYNNSAAYTYINVESGYQKLCGRTALQYVRFRHEDNDLVRSARQQDFLRQAKQQVGASELIDDRERLVKIFGKYTESDAGLKSRAELLRLLKLAVFSVNNPIREVHFEGRIGPSYVTASQRRVDKLVQQFLGVEETPGPRGQLAPKGKKRRKGGGDPGLEKVPAEGKDQAVQAVQQGAGGRLPVFYPTVRTKRALFAGPPRVYKIRANDGKLYGAYRMIIKRGSVGEYYGVQGTTWKDPPILRNPSETRRIGRRTFELQFAGDRVRLVSWRTKTAVYWVSNTLLQTLTERQMLAIARSTKTL